MSLSSAPIAVHDNGMKVASGLPTLEKGSTSNVQGGLLNAAVAKTQDGIARQAANAKGAGVTMKGGGTEIKVPIVPEGHSIPGTSFAKNHADLIGTANQLKASAVYDGLIGTQPYKVGGRKHLRMFRVHTRRARPERDENEPVLTAGRKHRRKTKNVRHSRRRTVRRKRSKRVHRSRRSRVLRVTKSR